MIDKVNNSYRSILKATGVFGIVQVIKLVISVVSSKFVAVFLGPIGIGLVSLFTNALNIVLAITNFEFLKTATREIALNHDENDNSKVSKTLITLQKMSIFIGLLGGIIVVLFSKTLSYYTFGNYDRQYWFVLLSIYLLVSSFSNARMAIIQGVNKINKLAWCNIIIAFFTSVGSVIIYHFYRIEGIIWVFLYSSFVVLVVTICFTRKFSFSFLPFNFKEFYNYSNPIFKLGFFLSLNLIFGQICNFIIKIYLNNNGASAEILGYYQVSSLILINYLGLVFNAMSYDYYPKLSAISLDNEKVRNLVNHQIEIALILVTPAVVFLYLSSTFLIKLLYTNEFLSSLEILKFALFSVIIKAVSLPIAYIILSKGNKMQYFKQELFSDFLNVSITIFLYYILGLKGIGIAYIVVYIVYIIYVYWIVNKHYEFYFIKSCINLIQYNILIGILALSTNFINNLWIKNSLLLIVLMVSIFYSYREFNKRIDIKGYVKSKLKR